MGQYGHRTNASFRLPLYFLVTPSFTSDVRPFVRLSKRHEPRFTFIIVSTLRTEGPIQTSEEGATPLRYPMNLLRG